MEKIRVTIKQLIDECKDSQLLYLIVSLLWEAKK